MERDAASRVQFVSTPRAIDRQVLSARGFPALTLGAEGIKGQGLVGQLRSLFKLPGALRQALKIIRDFNPHLVIGVGGYISGPVVLAAWLRRRPTVIQEQNSIPGLTNRLLGRMADRIFLAFEKSRDYFPRRKTRVTGNPVRRELQQARQSSPQASGPMTILVLGGSQGAHRLNQVVVESLGHLIPLKRDLFFIHQTGAKDADWVRQAYRDQGVAHQVSAFIEDMVWAYRTADLLICRAGAITLAEITALGKASLLVPFPFAANQHQEENARTLVQAGAAEMIRETELTAEILGNRIQTWWRDPGYRSELAARAAKLGRWQAAEEIVDSCYQLVGPHPEVTH